jgi:ribonuclease Z
MSKNKKIIRAVIAALIILPLAFVLLLRDSETLQDRVVKRALTSVMKTQMEKSASFGGDNLDAVFCGTASPMGASDRAQQCIAVLAGDRFFIVDSGARSAAKAAAAALPLGRLDGVLLTHFHSDHIAALGELHLQSWAQGRDGKLNVYGAKGVAQVVDGFNMAYGLDYGYRTAHHTEDFMPSKNAGLKARRFDVPPEGLHEIYNQGGLVISAFNVPHEPVRPAIGYRFDYKGRSIVVSGDTSKSAAMVAAAKNADVLIHEVLQPDLVNATSETLNEIGREGLGQIIFDTLDYHTSPVEAADIANQAEVALLVFTHFAPSPANGLIENIFMRGVDDVRDEGVVLADDGMMLRLPSDSDDIIVTAQ